MKKPCPLRFEQRSPTALELQAKPFRFQLRPYASTGARGSSAVSPWQTTNVRPVLESPKESP
jgi:hypothetical protein